MGHIPHLLHMLFHETKVGGWVAALGIAAGGAIGFWINPFLKDPATCKNGINTFTHEACQKLFDPEALASNLVIAVVGGFVGVGVALLFVDAGVKKDTLGIGDE